MVFNKYKFNLADMLSQEDLNLDESQVIVMIYNILLCMKYIHSTGIMHRDLKPSNILLTKDCHIALCDFGFARCTAGKRDNKKNNRALSPVCFTRYYRPPEVIL